MGRGAVTVLVLAMLLAVVGVGCAVNVHAADAVFVLTVILRTRRVQNYHAQVPEAGLRSHDRAKCTGCPRPFATVAGLAERVCVARVATAVGL